MSKGKFERTKPHPPRDIITLPSESTFNVESLCQFFTPQNGLKVAGAAFIFFLVFYFVMHRRRARKASWHMADEEKNLPTDSDGIEIIESGREKGDVKVLSRSRLSPSDGVVSLAPPVEEVRKEFFRQLKFSF